VVVRIGEVLWAEAVAGKQARQASPEEIEDEEEESRSQLDFEVVRPKSSSKHPQTLVKEATKSQMSTTALFDPPEGW
jgi:hypothetical protein